MTDLEPLCALLWLASSTQQTVRHVDTCRCCSLGFPTGWFFVIWANSPPGWHLQVPFPWLSYWMVFCDLSVSHITPFTVDGHLGCFWFFWMHTQKFILCLENVGLASLELSSQGREHLFHSHLHWLQTLLSTPLSTLTIVRLFNFCQSDGCEMASNLQISGYQGWWVCFHVFMDHLCYLLYNACWSHFSYSRR